jgi:hypothetical protein
MKSGHGKVSLAACLLSTLVASCGGGSSLSPSSSSSRAISTSASVPQAIQTSSLAPPPTATPGPHSKMLPEISVPTGSFEYEHNTTDDETWYFTTPYDQTITMLKAQLPIDQTFRGVPYCKGNVGDAISGWNWSTNTEDLEVFVTPPSKNPRPQGQIEFRWQAVTDGNGRDGCTAPLPASVSAQPPPGPAPTNAPGSGPLPHSDEAEIDMPPGSWLAPSNPETVKTHSEIWNYDVSQSDMVAWLKQRLPVGQPFHGIPWCGAPQIEGQTSWEWLSNGQRFYVQVTNYGLVEFQRGPTDWPCTD